MADIQHATLPDERLHQPKGASSAAANTWMRANGDGSTTFTSLPTSDLQVSDSLTSTSFAAQQLALVDDEAQITFGTPETSPSGSISIDSFGNVVFNNDGVYDVKVLRNATRSTDTDVNTIAFSLRLDGVQAGGTILASLDNTNPGTGRGSYATGPLQITAGTTLSDHMLYLAGVSGTIGLDTEAISATGWGDAPSAQITISKLEV